MKRAAQPCCAFSHCWSSRGRRRAIRFAGRALDSHAAVDPAASRRSSPSNGMVVAQERRAARIGVEILDRGGNAVDAAVAVGFAMAVTYPRAGNIGGGGFMVIHLANGNRTSRSTIARRRRPRRRRRCFSTRKGEADPKKSRDSGACRSACPARSRGLRWRRRNTARANSRSPT